MGHSGISFRWYGEQGKVKGAAEEQMLGQSLILLHPVHSGWNIRSQLCQAWRKGKLLLLELEHLWALYLKSLPFNVQGNIIEKVCSSCPDQSTCSPTLCWGCMARSRDTISHTSPLIIPMASPLNQSLASSWQGKGMYFLLVGITSLEWYVLWLFEWKMRKAPYGPFPLWPT